MNRIEATGTIARIESRATNKGLVLHMYVHETVNDYLLTFWDEKARELSEALSEGDRVHVEGQIQFRQFLRGGKPQQVIEILSPRLDKEQ